MLEPICHQPYGQAEFVIRDPNGYALVFADYRIVEGAGHYIHRDRPEAVVAAIRDVVTAVRGGGPVPSESADAQR